MISHKLRSGLAWALVVVLFAVTQFSREIFNFFGRLSYKMLFWPVFGPGSEWIQKTTGYHIYNPRFWAKAFSTGLMGLLLVAALLLFARTKGERKLLLGLLGAGGISMVVLNVAGKALHIAWLQTFSRDTLEMLTSPLPVLFLIPVLIMYRRTRQG